MRSMRVSAIIISIVTLTLNDVAHSHVTRWPSSHEKYPKAIANVLLNGVLRRACAWRRPSKASIDRGADNVERSLRSLPYPSSNDAPARRFFWSWRPSRKPQASSRYSWWRPSKNPSSKWRDKLSGHRQKPGWQYNAGFGGGIQAGIGGMGMGIQWNTGIHSSKVIHPATNSNPAPIQPQQHHIVATTNYPSIEPFPPITPPPVPTIVSAPSSVGYGEDYDYAVGYKASGRYKPKKSENGGVLNGIKITKSRLKMDPTIDGNWVDESTEDDRLIAGEAINDNSGTHPATHGNWVQVAPMDDVDEDSRERAVRGNWINESPDHSVWFAVAKDEFNN